MALQVRRNNVSIAPMSSMMPQNDVMMRPSRRELDSLLQALGGNEHRCVHV